MEAIALAVGMLIGVFMGMILRGSHLKTHCVGTCRIGVTEGDDAYFTVKLDVPGNVIEAQKYIILKVEPSYHISQK